jgi:hypothetical protein
MGINVEPKTTKPCAPLRRMLSGFLAKSRCRIVRRHHLLVPLVEEGHHSAREWFDGLDHRRDDHLGRGRLMLRGMIVDKAAIFNELTKRNALRRLHGLPVLDILAEFHHAVAVAAEGAYRDRCQEHSGEREVIRQQVLAEYRERFGPDFGHSMGGRWAVGEMAKKRFAAFMADRYRVPPRPTYQGTQSPMARPERMPPSRRCGNCSPKGCAARARAASSSQVNTLQRWWRHDHDGTRSTRSTKG